MSTELCDLSLYVPCSWPNIFIGGVGLKTTNSILKQMLSLLLQNHLILRLHVENIGGKQEGLFFLLKNSSFLFSQEGLCFAFTSGIFQSSELNSKSAVFGTGSGCTHLHQKQALRSSSRLPSPGVGRRRGRLGMWHASQQPRSGSQWSCLFPALPDSPAKGSGESTACRAAAHLLAMNAAVDAGPEDCEWIWCASAGLSTPVLLAEPWPCTAYCSTKGRSSSVARSLHPEQLLTTGWQHEREWKKFACTNWAGVWKCLVKMRKETQWRRFKKHFRLYLELVATCPSKASHQPYCWQEQLLSI